MEQMRFTLLLTPRPRTGVEKVSSIGGDCATTALTRLALGRGEDGRPIAAEAAAIDGDAALVDLRRGEHGVDEARQHALGARPPRSRPRGGALTRRAM